MIKPGFWRFYNLLGKSSGFTGELDLQRKPDKSYYIICHPSINMITSLVHEVNHTQLIIIFFIVIHKGSYNDYYLKEPKLYDGFHRSTIIA